MPIGIDYNLDQRQFAFGIIRAISNINLNFITISCFVLQHLIKVGAYYTTITKL